MKKQQIIVVQQENLNKKRTSWFTKLIRTLSFLTLLAVFSRLLLHFIFDANVTVIFIDQLQSLLQPIQDLLLNFEFLQDGFIIASALMLSLLLLTLTVSKSTPLKLILTILFILSYITMVYKEVFIISYMEITIPTFLVSYVDLIRPTLDSLFELSDLMPYLIMFITLVFLILMLGFRKPKRFSLSLFRMGIDSIVLGLFMIFLKIVLIDAFIPVNLYDLVKNYAFVIGYVIVMIGSLFGILGFFRN